MPAETADHGKPMCPADRIFVTAFVLVVLPVGVLAQIANPDHDARLEPARRVEIESPLGPITVGLSGVTEHARLQSTTGDVEFGTIYQIEMSGVFPRLVELRPFVFNRVESTTESYYESLGLGVGMQASIRKKHEQNNWFVRLSMLTPTDLYRDRYNQDRDQDSIFEAIAGYEVPLNPGDHDHNMRERLTGRTTVVMKLPALLFDPEQAISPDLLRQMHTLIITAYLSRVALIEGQPGPLSGVDWSVLQLLERVTGEPLGRAQWLALQTDMVADPDERVARRRKIIADALRTRLIAAMRGPYPLLFEPLAAPPARAGSAITVAHATRPGMSLGGERDPLHVDAMIDHYIAAVLAGVR